MPRAFDRRIAPNDHDPLAGLLDFEDITKTVEQAGDAIRNGVVSVIKELTGIDLSSFVHLFDGIFDEIGLDLPGLADLNPVTLLNNLVGAFDGLDLGPGAIATAIANALDSVPLIGDIADLIESLVLGGGGSGDSGFPYTFPFTFGGAPSPVALFFENLRTFFGPIDFASGAFDFNASWESFVNGSLIGDSLDDVRDFVQQLIDAVISALTGGPSVGGLISQVVSELGGLQDDAHDALANAANALGGLGDLGGDVLAGFTNLYSAWFNAPSGSTNTTAAAADVVYVIESVKHAVVNGYQIDTFTTNGTWTVPANLLECKFMAIGGGGRGGLGGQGASGEGGTPGISGGYKAVDIEPAALTPGSTVTVTVGMGATTPGTTGGVTSFAASGISTVSSVPGLGSASNPDGYYATTSLPGNGGKGGDASGNGENGENSAVALGGFGATYFNNGGGAVTTGRAGGNGGSVSLIDNPKSGGGGGGGGGAASGASSPAGTHSVTGGAGGAGGYPGGGSGGGGTAAAGGSFNAQIRGPAGVTPNGCAFIKYKTG